MERNMANKKKNTRYRRNKGGRLDMRKGGRVALKRGGKRKPSKAQVLQKVDPNIQPTQPKTRVKQPSISKIHGGRRKPEKVRSESGRLQNQPQVQEASVDQIRRQQKGIPEEQRGLLYDPKRPQPLPSTPLPSVRQVPIPEGKPMGTLNPNLREPPVMDARQEERIRKAQEEASRRGGEHELLRGMQEAQKVRGRGRKGQPRPAVQDKDRAVALPAVQPPDFKRSDRRAFSAQAQQGMGKRQATPMTPEQRKQQGLSMLSQQLQGSGEATATTKPYIDVNNPNPYDYGEPQPTVSGTAQEEDIVTIPPVTTGQIDDGSGGGYREENGNGPPPPPPPPPPPSPPAPIATVAAKAKSPEEKASTKAKTRKARRATGTRQFRIPLSGGPTGLNIG